MTFQELARDAIRASGGRITSQRELLLDLLASIATDIDAEHLYQMAISQDPHISLPTIYRTLNTLEAAEIITSHYVSSEHERKTYRIRDTGSDVFHFTCRSCGQVTAVQSALFEQVKHEISTRLDADILSLCMCASGLCTNCREG